jgi:hypothetical protein
MFARRRPNLYIQVIHPNWVRDAVDENFPIPIARYVINGAPGDFIPPSSLMLHDPYALDFGLTDDYESSYADLNQDCGGDNDDSGSDQSQQEVLEQLLSRHSPSPSPNSNSNTFFPTTRMPSANMNQIFKRPHILDDSESHENRPFKIPRFPSPKIHYVSPPTIDSESAPTSQSQALERPRDRPDHAICYHEPFPFQLPPREHPNKKLSTRSNETPDWIKFVGRVASLDPNDKSTSADADKSAESANQSDSTLVASTSMFVFLGLEHRD